MRSLVVSVAVLTFCATSSPAHADYVVTGQPFGTECTNLIFAENCVTMRVDAMLKPDGSAFEFREYWKDSEIDSYDEAHRMCHIKVTWTSRWIPKQMFAQRRPDGSYEVFNPQTIRFPCRKVA